MSSFFDFQAELNARKAAARRPRASSKTASASPIAGEAPLSVSELTSQIDKVLKAGLPGVLHVRGEVSNFKSHAASGHAYFTLKDPDGVMIIKAFINTAKTSGKGWVDYKYPNPITNKLDQKSSYVELYEGLILGCGMYKK